MKRRLYTLAYPKLARRDRQLIDGIRSEHDLPYKDVVKPHFTLVFSCDDVHERTYLAHVSAVARESRSIKFHCRYAMLGADDVSSVAYVFLVPDEGNSALSLLHDKLYTGILAPKLRLDLEFIPHITIATLEDRQFAKDLCDRLNATPISISGSIDALTVSALDVDRIEDVASFPLEA